YRTGNKGSHRVAHTLIDKRYILFGIEPRAFQRPIEKDMGRGSNRGGNLFTLEILYCFDAHIRVDPELRCGVLNIVDQERLPSSTSREIGYNSACGQHIDAAANHRLKQLKPGCELDKVHVQALIFPCPHMVAQPDLAIDRKGMQITDLHRCLCPGGPWRQATNGANCRRSANTLKQCAAGGINIFRVFRLHSYSSMSRA